MYIIRILLTSLGLTLVLELLMSFILKVKDKYDYLNIILVNILTNPILVSLSLYINIHYGLSAKKILIIPMEIIVVLIEGLIYKKYLKYKRINPFIFSFILNLASYIIGAIINLYIY